MGMIRISPGDLLQISSDGKFYYALVLDKIQLFGGQLVFAFHRTSIQPLAADELFATPFEGFFDIVDFIWTKREKRIERIASKLDVAPWNTRVRFFKNTHATKEKAKEWWIYDREQREIKRTPTLTAEEKSYPLRRRIDDSLMFKLVDERWSPENDPRI